MEEKNYSIRIVPFVKYITKEKNGKKYEDVIDNLTYEEIRTISCEPRMFRREGDYIYLAEMPLAFRGGTGIKGFLCYVYDELSTDEQKKFATRSIVVRTNNETVVQVYGESSKKFFGRRKSKKK